MSQNSLFYSGLKLYNEFCEFNKSKDDIVNMGTKMSATNYAKLQYPFS
jgi:hypothetical protein